jgi:hypothetical protein
MDTVLVEHAGSVLLAAPAHLDRPEDIAAVEVPDKANPFLRYIRGNFVESDRPNTNKQMWTAPDLVAAEHSIRYAPLNMVHRVTQPVGVFLDTATSATAASDTAAKGPVTITALAGMWSHVFPFETRLVEAADEAGALYYSMECRGSHLVCAGKDGCGEKFAYAEPDSHCEHLKDRASVRHIVDPVFRGGALIIPPIQPGWSGATATVLDEELLAEAARLAETTAAADPAMSAADWEQLMAGVLALAA